MLGKLLWESLMIDGLSDRLLEYVWLCDDSRLTQRIEKVVVNG